VTTSSAATHPGRKRSRNEDRLVQRPDLGLWAVADGAGGHGAGDVASSAIADALMAIPPGFNAAEMLAQLRLRLGAVNADLRQKALERGGMIASTIVILLLRGDYYAALWAGDSRIYLWRDGALQRITHDHSLVQEMVDAGTLSPEAAETHPQANIITRAVGAEAELVLDKAADRRLPGDRFLLCSDGVFKELPEAEMAALVAAGADAEALVNRAVEAGGRDNVTVVLVATDAPPGVGPSGAGADGVAADSAGPSGIAPPGAGSSGAVTSGAGADGSGADWSGAGEAGPDAPSAYGQGAPAEAWGTGPSAANDALASVDDTRPGYRG